MIASLAWVHYSVFSHHSPNCVNSTCRIFIIIQTYFIFIHWYKFKKCRIVDCNLRICDLLWCNREQVARQMLLIITCTLSYDQHRHYPMHSAKHNAIHHWWYDSFYNSHGKPCLLVKVSLGYWNGVSQLLDRNALSDCIG